MQVAITTSTRRPYETDHENPTQVKQYEVLIGQHMAIRWVRVSGKLKLHELHRPIQGGHENDQDRTPLFVARARHHGIVVPGKINVYMSGACITVGDKEVEVEVRFIFIFILRLLV